MSASGSEAIQALRQAAYETLDGLSKTYLDAQEPFAVRLANREPLQALLAQAMHDGLISAFTDCLAGAVDAERMLARLLQS